MMVHPSKQIKRKSEILDLKNLVFLILFLIVSCFQKNNLRKADENLAPKIVEIFPTSDTLPENLLRFYIQFSRSMKAVNNLENIKLLDETGEEIKGAIFNNVHELWDSEQKQLTLILDPARVKTGLKAHESFGRALVPGRNFQLVIEKAEDIYGNHLKEPIVKSFFVEKADIQIPDVKNWEIIYPKSNSMVPLRIQFPEPLDRLSLIHRIRLLDENKRVEKGKIEIINQEKEWLFTPEEKWKNRNYTLQINSRLEDPSGNNLNGLFDHEIGSLKSEQEGEIVEININLDYQW